ncbi:MAG: AIR synthase family protein [Anaerolineae bacterium]|nr:AIR synthase family protein [Anaerolineae bacterium]
MPDKSYTLLPGKLPPELLRGLLAGVPHDPSVIVGPGVGEDAAVIDLGGRYLVAKTDPITFATDEVGWYAVQVNANDLAATGAVPRWFMATVLLPAGEADAALATRIFEQIVAACQAIGVTLVGGHTEITGGIDRPIVVGMMLGEVAPDRLVLTSGAQPGDAILLTKGVPIEATSIIAREKRAELANHFDPAFLDRAAAFLKEPGISVLKDAQVACAAGRVTAMHDPTEGGLATALWELAEASGHTLVIEADAWPICEEGERLCAFFGLDPLAAISSGALLLAVHPADRESIMAALEAAGIPVFWLGHVAAGPVDVRAGGQRLERPARDEIARLFERPGEQGAAP